MTRMLNTLPFNLTLGSFSVALCVVRQISAVKFARLGMCPKLGNSHNTFVIILLKDGVVLTLLSLFIITSSDLFSTGDRRESSQSKNRGSGQKEISRPV